MKRTPLLAIVSGLWLVLGQFSQPGFPARISGVAFEEMLPEDTMFYLCVPNAREFVGKLKNSNGYKIIREIDPIELMKGVPEFERARRFYRTYVLPLTEVFQGRIAVAVKNISPGAAVPGAVFLADVCGKRDELRHYLTERLHPALKQAGVQIVSFKYDGYEVQQLSFARPVPFAACYCIAEDLFIATVGRGTMEELLDQPKRERSLAGSRLFQVVRGKLGEGSGFRMYANVSALLRDVAPSTLSSAKALLTASGLRGVKAVGISAEVRGRAIKHTLFLATGPRREGFLGLLARSAPPLKAVGYVPEDVTFFSAVSLGDFGEFWDGVMDALRETLEASGAGPEWQGLIAKLRQWEERSGFRIRKDILSPFAGEVCVAVKVPEVLGVPPTFLLIEVKDPQKAKALIEKLIAYGGKRLGVPIVRTVEEYKGVTITSISLSVPGRGGSAVGVPFLRPAFAVEGDFLVVGVHSALVKKVVDVHRGGKALNDNAEFNRVLRNFSERGSATSYVNVREAYKFLYGAFSGLAARRVGPDIMAKLWRVERYFGSSGSRISGDDEGMTYEVFSDSGVGQLIFVQPVLAGIMGVTRARGQAQAAVCSNKVWRLAQGCTQYAGEHHDVLPVKLSDLYPNYVADLSLFVCPVHKGKKISKGRIDTESDYKLEIPGKKIGAIEYAANTIMISEKETNHRGGRNVAYADGHVQRVGETGRGAVRSGAVGVGALGISEILVLLIFLL